MERGAPPEEALGLRPVGRSESHTLHNSRYMKHGRGVEIRDISLLRNSVAELPATTPKLLTMPQRHAQAASRRIPWCTASKKIDRTPSKRTSANSRRFLSLSTPLKRSVEIISPRSRNSRDCAHILIVCKFLAAPVALVSIQPRTAKGLLEERFFASCETVRAQIMKRIGSALFSFYCVCKNARRNLNKRVSLLFRLPSSKNTQLTSKGFDLLNQSSTVLHWLRIHFVERQ